MNTKLFVLLGGVGAVHLVAGALFIAGGCAQEDPPMPPGIYVPKQSVHEPAGPAPAPVSPETAGQADLSTPTQPESAPTVVSTETAAPAPAAKTVEIRNQTLLLEGLGRSLEEYAMAELRPVRHRQAAPGEPARRLPRPLRPPSQWN